MGRIYDPVMDIENYSTHCLEDRENHMHMELGVPSVCFLYLTNWDFPCLPLSYVDRI